MTTSGTALRRWAGTVTAVVVGLAAAVSAAPARAVAPSASYVLSGVVTDVHGTPVDFDQVLLRQETVSDDPLGSFDESAGVTYRDLPDVTPDGSAAGHYAVSLAPGRYRLTAHLLPRSGAADQIAVGEVTITDHDETLDLGLDDGFACTTPGAMTGVAQVGRTLTAVPGDFAPAYDHRLTYQWWRHDPTRTDRDAWAMIAGARSSTYDLTTADLGHTLEVDVSGLSAHGDAICSYSDTAVVVGPDGAWLGTPPGPVTVPRTFAVGRVDRPTGRAVVGGVLRVVRPTLPAGAVVRYRWFRATRSAVRPIAGARSAAYRLRPADRAARVFVRLSLAAPGYESATVRSQRVLVR